MALVSLTEEEGTELLGFPPSLSCEDTEKVAV